MDYLVLMGMRSIHSTHTPLLALRETNRPNFLKSIPVTATVSSQGRCRKALRRNASFRLRFVPIRVVSSQAVFSQDLFGSSGCHRASQTTNPNAAPTPKTASVVPTFCHRKTVGSMVRMTVGSCGVPRFCSADGRFPQKSQKVPDSISDNLLVGSSTRHNGIHEATPKQSPAPNARWAMSDILRFGAMVGLLNYPGRTISRTAGASSPGSFCQKTGSM